MQAWTYQGYGSAERLQLRELETPQPAENEVLVRVRAVSLNASDHEFLSGAPFYVRFWGWRKPRNPVLGSDIAGEVVALGPGVRQVQIGEAIIADLLYHWGGLAEYVRVPLSCLVRKPAALSFAQAACLPQAAVVALQALRYRGAPGPGEHWLINGAAGGTGLFVLALARNAGVSVTGVDRGDKLARLAALGANAVIDYQQQDFSRSQARYDRIIDLVGSRPLWAFARALKPGGRYLMVGGPVRRILQTLCLGPLLSRFSGKHFGLLSHAFQAEDLEFILQQFAQGQLQTEIAETFSFAQTPEAFRFFAASGQVGKIVIAIDAK